jgi:L-fuconolactonase
MHIDAHQHFWRYDPGEYAWIDDSMKTLRRDFLPGDLKPELERNGFDRCIAVQARQTLEETRWLLELADRHAFIGGVVGWVDLRSPGVRNQLESLERHPKLIGIRHIVQSEPDDRFMLQPDFLRGIAILEEFGLTYDILIYARHLAAAAEFVRRFERQRFVLDHIAKPEIKAGSMSSFGMWARGIRDLASFPNVFCKLSGLVTEADWGNWKAAQFELYLDVVFDYFGGERLMIGSDWPVCTLAASYSDAMNLVKNYLSKHSSSVQEAALGGNAKRFWSLQ